MLKRICLAFALFVLGTSPLLAQSSVLPYFYTTGNTKVAVSNANPLPVSATASISGFAPATTGTPISVTTGGVTGSLPAGTVVVAFNIGSTNTAYCKLGASATTSDVAIPPQSWFAFTVGAATQLTCITSTSTTTVNMVGGSGLATGAGGGGGGGGGGAITIASGAVASGAYSSGSIASGAMVDLGAQADSVCGTATGTCSLIALTKYLNTAVGSAIPAGTNLIGDVNLRQGGTALSTTNGIYSNLLQGNAVLSASNALFAKQTDGTNVVVTDPCQAATKLYKAFSQTATAVLVTGAASKKTYVCSISIIAGAAEIFNLTAGTGSTCGTNTVAVMGSTTAANGLSLAANGGLTFGSGLAALAATTVNQDDLCLQQSGSNRLAGGITYVQI